MNSKFKILLVVVGITFISCNKDDDSSGCSCTGKFTTAENFGDGTYFYVNKTPINCDTRQYLGSEDIQDNAVFISCVDDF